MSRTKINHLDSRLAICPNPTISLHKCSLKTDYCNIIYLLLAEITLLHIDSSLVFIVVLEVCVWRARLVHALSLDRCLYLLMRYVMHNPDVLPERGLALRSGLKHLSIL